MSNWMGDYTNDNIVNVNDAQYILNWIAAGGSEYDTDFNYSVNQKYYSISSNSISRLDINYDLEINVNDAQYILNWIAAGGDMNNRTVVYSVNNKTYTIEPRTSERLEATNVNYQNAATLIAVINDSKFIKEGDAIAAYDLSGEIHSYESLRTAKNDPPLLNQSHLATITINDVILRQYANSINNYTISFVVENASTITTAPINGTAVIIGNELSYTPNSSNVTDEITITNGVITIKIEPRYYFGGNIGLESDLTNVTYKYWDSETSKTHDLVYLNGDNPSSVNVNSVLGKPYEPVVFEII